MKAQGIYKTENGRNVLTEFEDSVLGTWPFHHTQASLPTRFGQTHTLTAGSRDRPALLLLHGSASNVLGWGGAIPQYMDDFYVIAPDIPGDPGKSDPVRLNWSSNDFCLWLDDVMGALGVQTAALLGISLGGWIAVKYAAARPDRVSRLVLLAPGGFAPARPSAIAKTVLYSMQGRRGAEKLKRMVFGDGVLPPQVSEFFDLIQRHYVPRFGSPPLFTDSELTAIACPVLVHAAGEDVFFDAARCAARVRATLPQAIVQIDATGQHGITEYAGHIRSFLAVDRQADGNNSR